MICGRPLACRSAGSGRLPPSVAFFAPIRIAKSHFCDQAIAQPWLKQSRLPGRQKNYSLRAAKQAHDELSFAQPG